ncbi:MAG: PIG-L family deacetylase [Candidatus Aenigmarchaeota archaeon]|nr:PIG-L family deacetylase [Candidatus Aenigmarchaeota archaeon]
MKILVFSAHPDDADFGCGGTVAKKAAEGHEIHYVVATGGQKGKHGIDASSEQFALMREEEQRNSAAILGVKSVMFLKFVDGELENNDELRRWLVHAIREKKPDILMSMDPSAQKFDSVYRYHKDHRTIAMAVFDAGYPAAGNNNFYPETGEPWTPKEFWFFGGEPNHHEDTTSFINTKIMALLCHKSQVNPEEMEKWVRQWAEDTGKNAGMPYAEAFRILSFNR